MLVSESTKTLFLRKFHFLTMAKYIITLILALGLTNISNAQYDVNENCQNAWMLLMDLKVDDAKRLLAKEIERNPTNYYAYYVDQYCDAYGLLINSNIEAYEKFISDYYDKREIMDDQDIESPYYLSCYGEMELQAAIFEIIHGSTFSGLRKAYSAYRNTYRNIDDYPDFQPNLKMDGFYNVALSNLPPFVKWAAGFFGVSGELDYGFKLLYENYENQKNIKGINAESALMIILAAKINKTPEMIYDFTKSLDTNISHTFIHSYFRANVAYRTGRNEEALATLSDIDISKHAYADLIYNYMMGKILLRKLDDSAGYYLSKYLVNLQKKEYLKEINYSLALHYLLKGDTLKYNELCKVVINEGKDINERDREALYDAELDYFPNIDLVKARLLLDGKYYQRFEDAIETFERNKSNVLGHELEHEFLLARYNADIGNTNVAISKYKAVIEKGEDEDYYFACESALRLADIFFNEGSTEQAAYYYEKSLKLYQKHYYEYIEDKAQKGKKRAKNI